MDDVYQRLVAAVMAEPESDEPRLVLADYLEELGDPRAEFIRVQCELASIDQRSREFYQRRERSDALRRARKRAEANHGGTEDTEGGAEMK